MRAAASAAKPTAGSWLKVWTGRILDSSAILKNGSAKSPGMPKISPAPRSLRAVSRASTSVIRRLRMTLVEALLTALKDRGAGEIFGIPGDFALPFFKIAEESRILPVHTLSHEPAVGFAADAAARMRGTLGVAAVTYGAGAFNLVNTVAGAYAERVPMVVLSGAPAAGEAASGYQLHH